MLRTFVVIEGDSLLKMIRWLLRAVRRLDDARMAIANVIDKLSGEKSMIV